MSDSYPALSRLTNRTSHQLRDAVAYTYFSNRSSSFGPATDNTKDHGDIRKGLGGHALLGTSAYDESSLCSLLDAADELAH